MTIRPPIPSHMVVTIQSLLLCNSKEFLRFYVTPVPQRSPPDIPQNRHMLLNVRQHLPTPLCQAWRYCLGLLSYLIPDSSGGFDNTSVQLSNTPAQSADNRRFAIACTIAFNSLLSREVFFNRARKGICQPLYLWLDMF